MSFARIMCVIDKILRGRSILTIQQDQEAWNKQFSHGSWDFMINRNERHALLFVAALIKQIAGSNQKELLDVGCGNGGLTQLLADIPSISYVGLDLSSKAIDVARRFHTNGTFFVASAEIPPNFGKQFDILVFNEVLYYTDFQKTWDAYRPYLKPDAIVLVTMYRSWRTWIIWHLLRSRLQSMERIVVTDRLRNKEWTIEYGNYI